MKVLVTGASGFFGSHLAEQLAAGGHQIRALLRKTSSRRHLAGFAYEEAPGDVTDAASLTEAVEGVDAVVHAAGLVKARSGREFEAVNVGGTGNVVAAVERAAPGLARLVYVSSLAAHGPSRDGRPRPADAPPAPVSVYGRSKLGGEELVRRSPVAGRSVIFRMPVIYGPRDPGMVHFFRLARMRVAPLLMGGRNVVSVVYVDDAVRAVLAALSSETAAGKTYCAEDGRVYSWRDLLAAIEVAVGRRALRLYSPRWAYEVAALGSQALGFVTRRAMPLSTDKVREMAQCAWVCSAEPLTRDLGWTARVGFAEGAKVTASWYLEHKWI